LFRHLFDDLIIPSGDDRHGGDRGIEGFGYGKALNIETSAAEEACDPGQDSELIFDQESDYVTHGIEVSGLRIVALEG
jgi:hypothetical protein